MDDTQAVQKRQYVNSLFDHINSRHDKIKFTKEEENENQQLPVLDVLMTREGNKVTTNVYRKPTHTDHYLQWDSHHPVAHKLSVVRTLYHRVGTHIKDEKLKKVEIEKIKSDLKKMWVPRLGSEDRPS